MGKGFSRVSFRVTEPTDGSLIGKMGQKKRSVVEARLAGSWMNPGEPFTAPTEQKHGAIRFICCQPQEQPSKLPSC